MRWPLHSQRTTCVGCYRGPTERAENKLALSDVTKLPRARYFELLLSRSYIDSGRRPKAVARALEVAGVSAGSGGADDDPKPQGRYLMPMHLCHAVSRTMAEATGSKVEPGGGTANEDECVQRLDAHMQRVKASICKTEGVENDVSMPAERLFVADCYQHYVTYLLESAAREVEDVVEQQAAVRVTLITARNSECSRAPVHAGVRLSFVPQV
jgi:hypothetical protein